MRGSVLGHLVSPELDVNIGNFCVCGWMLLLLIIFHSAVPMTFNGSHTYVILIIE